MTPYLWALMGMLVSATVFDSFNLAILSTVAPIIQQLHGLNNTQWGLVNLIIRVGAVVSFFILMLADRFGRRALITLTVLGYALFTGLTGMARTIESFTALAVLRAHLPGRRVRPGADHHRRGVPDALAQLRHLAARRHRRARHDRRLPHRARRAQRTTTGARCTCSGSFRWRWCSSSASACARRGASSSCGSSGQPHGSLRAQLASMRVPFQRRYRKRSLLVTLIWNCSHMVTSPAVTFWTIHAAHDLGYSAAAVHGGGRRRLSLRLPRRRAGGGILHEPRRPPAQLLGVLHRRGGNDLRAVPRHLHRPAAADGDDVGVHLLLPRRRRRRPTPLRPSSSPPRSAPPATAGRPISSGASMEIVTPLAIGWLADRIGIPWAVGVMAIGPVIGGLIVLRYAPETMRQDARGDQRRPRRRSRARARGDTPRHAAVGLRACDQIATTREATAGNVESEPTASGPAEPTPSAGLSSPR